MKKYFLVPYQAYAEGDYVSSKAVIVKASSARAVIDSLDQIIAEREANFPQ